MEQLPLLVGANQPCLFFNVWTNVLWTLYVCPCPVSSTEEAFLRTRELELALLKRVKKQPMFPPSPLVFFLLFLLRWFLGFRLFCFFVVIININWT